MRSLLLCILVLSIGGVACDDPNPGLLATADSVEVGTGEEVFASVPDDTVLSVVFGGQGGFHVWGSLRLGGFAVTGGPPVGRVGMITTFGIEHAEGTIAEGGPVTANVNAATGEYLAATVIPQINPTDTPFLYPPGFSTEEDWPSDEEWDEADEYLQARVAGGLRLWVSVEDAHGDVLEDDCIIGLQGLYAQDAFFR